MADEPATPDYGIFIDLPQVNVILSTPTNRGYMEGLDAATFPKMLYFVTNSSSEQDATLFLIGFKRFCTAASLLKWIRILWQHAWNRFPEDSRSSARILRNCINLLIMLPTFETKRQPSIMSEIRDWTAHIEDIVLLDKSRLPHDLNVVLLKKIFALRYAWSGQAEKAAANARSAENMSLGRASKKSSIFGDTLSRFKPSRLRRKGSVKMFISASLEVSEAALSVPKGFPDACITSFGLVGYLLRESPENFAAHLCLVQENLMAELSWRDIEDVKMWKKEDSLTLQKHNRSVSRLFSRSNSITSWVIWTILLPPYSADGFEYPRHLMIERMFAIAQALFHFRNFETMMAILSALQHPTIFRLHTSWKKVCRKVRIECGIETKSKAPVLMDLCGPVRNWVYLRRVLHDKILQPSLDYLKDGDRLTAALPPPGIYYFGLVTNDIILNEESKQDFVMLRSSNKMINVTKLFFHAKVIAEPFCIGCRGIDIYGQRVRKTYQETLFGHDDAFVLNPDIYVSCDKVDRSLESVLEAANDHPFVKSARQSGYLSSGELDMWNVSKALEFIFV